MLKKFAVSQLRTRGADDARGTVATHRKATLPVQIRAAVEVPASYDATAHTVELTAATEAPVRRYSWLSDTGYYQEVLDFSPGAVDLARVQAGQCPLLDTHSSYSIESQLGRVVEARLESGQLVTVVRFGQTDEASEAEQMVAEGTLTGVSIGYRVKELTLVEQQDGKDPVFRATQWELLEVSLVPVPADPAAGVRSDNGLHPCVIIETMENRTMDPEEIARLAREAAEKMVREALEAQAKPPAEAKPAEPDASAARMKQSDAFQFVRDARDLGVDEAQAEKWATELTPADARSQLVSAAAEKQRAQAPKLPAGEGARITADERDTQRSAIAIALMSRHDPKLKAEDWERGDDRLTDEQRRTLFAAAREWRGMSLLEIVRFAEEANGRKVRGLTKRELADLAFNRSESTSDLPNILANVANKTLRNGYETSPQTFKGWMRQSSAPDFKQISRTQLGGAPSFLQVPEGGQFKYGYVGDGKEVYALATYGRIIPVTRQTLINDDLDAFTRIPMMMGRAAADFESDTAYAPLNANPNMGDGTALFASGHGNLAGAGAAISVTTVQAGEIAMMSQTGLEGRPINSSPRYLLVSPKDKVPGQQLLTAILAQQSSNVNPYSNAMDLIVEVRLGRTSGATPWFMVADYNQVDTCEYAYLEGENGVYLEQRQGFEVDGIEFKARLDFATKAIDWRGMYQNPGT